MREQDIAEANEIQKNKAEMQCLLGKISDNPIRVSVGNVNIVIRPSTFRSMLDKDIARAAKQLTTLGVIDIRSQHEYGK